MDKDTFFNLIGDGSGILTGPPGIGKSQIIYDWIKAQDTVLNKQIAELNKIIDHELNHIIAKEKAMAKTYSVPRLFTGKEVMEAGACREELEKFVGRFGLFKPIGSIEVAWMVDHEQDNWLEWLTDHGFIKQEIERGFTVGEVTDSGYSLAFDNDGNNDTIQVYKNGHSIGSAHLFKISIEDGVVHINKCAGVNIPGEDKLLKLDDCGYVKIVID
jgi:hypothetical protein